ncbi:GMC oxidoreductase-domain-containing protein [Aspergillus granulosus]|uniref:GMC oxidoreductase-domain-containing protein n=1 Tax=Aspergillus granulosus TaxID=176169 RepID=A0ABR4H5F5_9EURO
MGCLQYNYQAAYNTHLLSAFSISNLFIPLGTSILLPHTREDGRPPFASIDYIVVGGGTSGLVLAARLSENPDLQILVLEAGPDRTSDPRVSDPDARTSLPGTDLDWDTKTVPQAALNNRETPHPAGKLLGGSSAINGLFWTPPLPAGMDAWAQLGNSNWTWDSMKQYIQKFFSLPQAEGEVEEGPIKISYTALLEDGKNNLLNSNQLIPVFPPASNTSSSKYLPTAWVTHDLVHENFIAIQARRPSRRRGMS